LSRLLLALGLELAAAGCQRSPPALHQAVDAGTTLSGDYCRAEMVFDVKRQGERFLISIYDPTKVEVQVQHQ
jgi:hypothetical protein